MTNGTPLPIFGSGLSEVEAQNRLQSEGYNELPRQDRRTPLRIVLEVFREPMFALLLGGGFIYLLLGDLKEALILLGFAIMSVAITVIQETRTERVLEALRDLTSPRALVIRDGVRRRIAGREVARGDLVVLAEGDRVPADAVLVQAHDVQADESLLTGESVPVRKIAAVSIPASSARPGGDDLPFVYSGALVVRGSGLAHVIGTGPRSEIGKIGQSLHALETEPPRLQLQTARLVRLSAFGGAAVSVGAVVLYGTLRGGWLDAVLTGITIGMSMLPEEFPVVLTVFMAMGAWRISKARVLTRRAASIETLGSATVLCTDKTGTLTENRMSIVELRLPDDDIFRPREATNAAVPDNFRELAAYGLLASTPEPFDPMEKAFHEFARDELEVADGLPGSDWKLAHSYGLRPELLAMSQLWQKDEGRSDFVVAAKGAPEIIADLCHLGPAELQAVRRSVDSMATEGLRVLGVAKAMHEGAQWPESQRDFPFVFLGLVGLADPLRSSVPAAVRVLTHPFVYNDIATLKTLFAQHPDEQLRDTAEGIGSRFGLGSQATIAMVGGRGRDCYVLCATLHNTEGVRKLFGNSNACIAIDNIQGFANAISLKLPYFTQGFEGPVIYQDDTTIYKTIGATTAEQLIEQYKNPDGTLRMEMLQDMHKMTGGIEEFFLKHSRHAQECEYRLLWAISQTPEPFIDIKVPDAIQFCRHVTKES